MATKLDHTRHQFGRYLATLSASFFIACTNTPPLTAAPVSEPVRIEDSKELREAFTTLESRFDVVEREGIFLLQTLVVTTTTEELQTQAGSDTTEFAIQGHAEIRGGNSGVIYIAQESKAPWLVFVHEMLHVLLFTRDVIDPSHREPEWERVPEVAEAIEVEGTTFPF